MPANVRSTSVASTLDEDVVIAPPASVVGDLLWAVHTSTHPLGDVPDGWDVVRTDSTFLVSVRQLRRTVNGSEPAHWTFGGDGVVIIAAIKDWNPFITPLIAVDDEQEGAGSISTPNVPPAAPSHLELRIAAAWTNTLPGAPTGALSAPTGYQLRGQAHIGQALAGLASRQVTSSTGSGPRVLHVSPADMGLGPIGVTISIASADQEPDTPPAPPITPGLGEALYRYMFFTWDGIYLDDLDLKGVHFDKRILQAGSLTATIPIPDRMVASRVARVFPRTSAELGIGPGAITCVVMRAGVPWGEYWITAAQYGRSGNEVPSIQVRGSTLEAYLSQVEMQSALTFSADDQIDIARTLLEHMQAVPYADLGLILQAGSSGVIRDREYKADEATYGQRLVELAEVDDGFEWRIDVQLGSTIERHWKWGHPMLGTQNPVPHVFSDGPDGGDVLGWSEELDALRGATAWRARGSSVDSDASTVSAPLMSAVHLAQPHLDAGWPRIDRTINRNSVTGQATLEDYAAYWAATAPGVLRVDSVTIALGEQPSITPNKLGDAARVHFDNQWHLPHWKTRRIIGIAVTPTSGEDGKETAQLVLEGQEAPS